MSARDYMTKAAARIKALAGLETAAGGVEEATWAVQAVTEYYQAGGTLERLQASMIADIEAGGPEDDGCENCGDPNCAGSTPVPLRAGFLKMGVELSFDDIEWLSYPLTGAMPDDVEQAADDYDNQLPTRLVRISDVLVREYRNNGQPTGKWFAAAAVTEATKLGL